MKSSRWRRELLIKETCFLRVCVSMCSLISRGHEPSYVMLRKTTSEKYLGFFKTTQSCCSRFQPLSYASFLLQGRMGYSNFIQYSGNKLSSLEECWSNTEVDGLMKLNALSRLSLRCFEFWIGWGSLSKDVVDSNTKLSEFSGHLSRRNSRALLACHGWLRLHGIGEDLAKER